MQLKRSALGSYEDVALMSEIDVGEVSEKLIHNFFDENFSSVYSFRSPKTSSNAQVADVFVWLNRVAFLIEVKGRAEGTASIDSWARSRIQQGSKQIVKNFKRFLAKEQVNLHNDYYDLPFANDGTAHFIGIIVLVTEEEITATPSNLFSDVYNQCLPIHVFTWLQLERMISEIDTTMDFSYYLGDRRNYLQISDIPLNREMDTLGYYKSHVNKFPGSETIDFRKDHWSEYQNNMRDQIVARNAHNKHSGWIDRIENLFAKQRKLYDGIPAGLYFSWEFGSMDRRVKSYLGEKLENVREWFDSGKNSRKFCFQNPTSGNWIVIYFASDSEEAIQKRLGRLLELKLIKEIEMRDFQFGAYGLGIKVSKIFPKQILGIVGAGFMGVDDDLINSVPTHIEEAYSTWGKDEGRKQINIEEFPH